MSANTKNAISERLSDLIATKIRELSNEHTEKVTQGKIAEFIGIKASSLSKYLNAVAEPTASQLIALSNYFEVSTDYLLGLEENPSPNPELRSVCKYTGLNENTIMKILLMSNMNFQLSNDTRVYKTDATGASVFNAIVNHMQVDFAFKMFDVLQGSLTVLHDQKEVLCHEPGYEHKYWVLSKSFDQILQNALIDLENEVTDSIKKYDFESKFVSEYTANKEKSEYEVTSNARKNQIEELRALSTYLIGADKIFEEWWHQVLREEKDKLKNGVITLDEFESKLLSKEWMEPLYEVNKRVRFCADAIREGDKDEKKKV